MDMFLLVLLVSLIASAASAAMFALATNGVDQDASRYLDLRQAPQLGAIPEQFFAGDRLPSTHPPVPLEVLLLQIERHVRLERAAGESFVQAPNVTSLYCRTTSPFVN